MVTDQKLIEIYQSARYGLRLANETLTFRVGEQSDKLDAILRQQNAQQAIFITACNPASQLSSHAINAENNRRLRAAIESDGYLILPGFGGDDCNQWPEEASWLVLDMPIVDANKLANKFEQNAYLVVTPGEPVALRWVKK